MKTEDLLPIEVEVAKVEQPIEGEQLVIEAVQRALLAGLFIKTNEVH